MGSRNKSLIGLVLTAGGARGAYQAGVLKRIGELRRYRNRPSPFRIVAGASAGAINGTAIASGSSVFSDTTKLLAEIWSDLKIQDVFRSDGFALGRIAATWLRDLSLGGIFGGGQAQSLLDASPLEKFLEKHIPFERIQDAIDRDHLYAVAVSATHYYSGKSYTFIQGQPGHPLWQRSRRSSIATPIKVEHVWASSAIPIVFQPVLIEGDFGRHYFGDGALRLVNPFSPAIRLGAERVFAIGIRSQRPEKGGVQGTNGDVGEKRPEHKPPVLAEIFGVALNSIFLDHLDADLDHLVRMNELISEYRKLAEQAQAQSHVPPISEPMRIVDPFVMKPSIDLSAIAETFASKMPFSVRYLMDGLGTSRAESTDLMSYLLFDGNFTRSLVDIGYKDAHFQIDQIEEFLARRE